MVNIQQKLDLKLHPMILHMLKSINAVPVRTLTGICDNLRTGYYFFHLLKLERASMGETNFASTVSPEINQYINPRTVSGVRLDPGAPKCVISLLSVRYICS